MPACRTCGAPIRWVITTHGKRMPVDALPVPGGNVLIHGGDLATVLSAAQVAECPDGTSLYLSHFVGCPQAAAHRQKGGT